MQICVYYELAASVLCPHLGLLLSLCNVDYVDSAEPDNVPNVRVVMPRRNGNNVYA